MLTDLLLFKRILAAFLFGSGAIPLFNYMSLGTCMRLMPQVIA